MGKLNFPHSIRFNIYSIFSAWTSNILFYFQNDNFLRKCLIYKLLKDSWQRHLKLPGDGFSLQCSLMCDSPRHWRPPLAGVGWLQVRVLVFTPPPHVTLHSPLTVSMKFEELFSLIDLTIFKFLLGKTLGAPCLKLKKKLYTYNYIDTYFLFKQRMFEIRVDGVTPKCCFHFTNLCIF